MKLSQGVGAAAVILGALAAGYTICHVQGTAAARQAADSAAKADHVRDSVAIATGVLLAQRDSAAQADSTRAEQLDRQGVVDRALRIQAQLNATAATGRLAAASGPLDSLRLYRDSIVPALGSEVGALTRELATVDSGRTAWHDAFAEQVARVGLLERNAANDSMLIARQRDALAAAAKIGASVTAPWSKLEGYVETSAITAATTGACAHKLLSVGCLAGAAVVVKRIL